MVVTWAAMVPPADCNHVGDSGNTDTGINTGRLGFLAAINYADVEETLQEVMNNAYNVQERTLLKKTPMRRSRRTILMPCTE